MKERARERLVGALADALATRGLVTPIDALEGAGMLRPQHVERWRRGLIPYLFQFLQGSLGAVEEGLRIYRDWAVHEGLQPSETAYTRHTRNGPVDLVFLPDAHPAVEKLFRTHFVSPLLNEKKLTAIKEKLEAPQRPTVFLVVRDTACSECGVELFKGEALYLEAGQALCLACAGMGDLEFLPAGDVALTRRATKYSKRSAVAVRFSRSRGRYERQGVLVEPAALAQAETECTADAAERAEARERAAIARKKHDVIFTAEMEQRIRELFPRCPPEEAHQIAKHTSERGSGRVGRSAAGRELHDKALFLAVVASVRHRHTDYDKLLARGVERKDARAQVRQQIDRIVDNWR